MQLRTHTWGGDDRVALLIHGIMADPRTWRRAGPALAERGYRIIAVDLRGHGASGRAEYGPELFAQDVAETLPAGADLAIGHSPGGLTLSLAVDRLKPKRAVFSDPAWHLADPAEGMGPELLAQVKSAPREQIRAMNPRWEEADIDVELETPAVWDAALLEEGGFEVRSVAGAGHTIHRDDFDGFTASLEGWIQPL
ncbi:alpha/beta fold hydrolase [Streptomyces sp. NPDC051109]|uniref:alpha/beta fold hydrolase n=1 Tax=Streptomyces sp. NPDC051109 TaxID=3365642 RepID=UPI0037B0B251